MPEILAVVARWGEGAVLQPSSPCLFSQNHGTLIFMLFLCRCVPASNTITIIAPHATPGQAAAASQPELTLAGQ